MLWKLDFLHSPFIYVLTDINVMISSVISMNYLECHRNSGPSVEDMTHETKKSWGSEKGQSGYLSW